MTIYWSDAAIEHAADIAHTEGKQDSNNLLNLIVSFTDDLAKRDRLSGIEPRHVDKGYAALKQTWGLDT